MTTTEKVPPDGGYGWVIVFANALCNVVIIPLMQSFGLIFKDTFIALGLSATEGSLIINLNSAFGMLVGLINGVLLKVFGYRKIALLGAFLVTTGIILTAYSTTFTHFMVAYGLVTSFGMGMSMSAYSLALNTYFRKNKSKAVGYAMTITGLGPIIMPQIITALMKVHTIQGVTLILAAISAHSFVSAMLLQPVKWHMVEKKNEEKLEDIQEEDEELEDDTKLKFLQTSMVEEGGRSRIRKDSHMGSILSINYDQESAAILGMDSALGGSVVSLHSIIPPRRQSVVSRTWKASNHSLEGSKLQEQRDSVYNPEMTKPIKKKSLLKRVWLDIAHFFDLDLLKDPIYVNIMVGMSLAIFAEFNFSVLTAFILADMELSNDQIATFMSVLGIADIIFRFFAPYIGDWLNKPVRPMYMLTLLMLISTRFMLLISNNYIILLGVALALGVAKGVRTVYMSLVIPTYVPIEKLASAAGIQMMVNGVCLLIGGPILGVVRDVTGSYNMCIFIMNCVTFTTVIMWTVEAIIVKYKKRKETPTELTEQVDGLLK